MKSTGIKQIDSLGRFVLPMEIRRALGIKNGDPLEIYVNDGAVMLLKYFPEGDYIRRLAELRDEIDEDPDIAVDIRKAIADGIDEAIRGLEVMA